MTPDDLARAADIRARQRCDCGHELRDHVSGTGRCTEDNDRDWYCPCTEFETAEPADVPWLLDQLAAETAENDGPPDLVARLADSINAVKITQLERELAAETERADKAEAAVRRLRVRNRTLARLAVETAIECADAAEAAIEANRDATIPCATCTVPKAEHGFNEEHSWEPAF